MDKSAWSCAGPRETEEEMSVWRVKCPQCSLNVREVFVMGEMGMNMSYNKNKADSL